jgi:hypothetical protein
MAYPIAAAVRTIGTPPAATPNAEVNAELAPPEMRARYQSIFLSQLRQSPLAGHGRDSGDNSETSSPGRKTQRAKGREGSSPAAADDAHPHRRRPH